MRRPLGLADSARAVEAGKLSEERARSIIRERGAIFSRKFPRHRAAIAAFLDRIVARPACEWSAALDAAVARIEGEAIEHPSPARAMAVDDVPNLQHARLHRRYGHEARDRHRRSARAAFVQRRARSDRGEGNRQAAVPHRGARRSEATDRERPSSRSWPARATTSSPTARGSPTTPTASRTRSTRAASKAGVTNARFHDYQAQLRDDGCAAAACELDVLERQLRGWSSLLAWSALCTRRPATQLHAAAALLEPLPSPLPDRAISDEQQGRGVAASCCLVSPVRFELTTNGLKGRCSTG